MKRGRKKKSVVKVRRVIFVPPWVESLFEEAELRDGSSPGECVEAWAPKMPPVDGSKT